MPQPQDYQPGEFQWSFLLPKYWSIWIGIIFLMILAILPWAIQYRLGQWLGQLAFRYLHSRRKTTVRNLELLSGMVCARGAGQRAPGFC